MKNPRIISFLPAATEMVYALGLGDLLVGVSHECDFPAAAKSKPVVVKPALPLETMSLREIDVAVAKRIGSGQSLYEVDENLLRELKPDMILTQNLCQVCGPSGNEITVALKLLQPKPEIVWMTPHSLEDIFQNIRELGAVTERVAEAEALVCSLRQRLEKVSSLTRNVVRRPRIFCLEWVDPCYCCGHWVPEMVEFAGAEDALGRKGTDSVRMAWTDIVAWAPEILIVAPCGFNTEQAVAQAKMLLRQPGWSKIPAVRNNKVFAVNANAYFARPGPRVVDGVELLAHLVHPEICEWAGPAEAFQRIDPRQVQPLPAREKVCPECGASFACGSEGGAGRCWCDQMPALPASALAQSDCLCPKCLARVVENARIQTA